MSQLLQVRGRARDCTKFRDPTAILRFKQKKKNMIDHEPSRTVNSLRKNPERDRKEVPASFPQSDKEPARSTHQKKIQCSITKKFGL